MTSGASASQAGSPGADHSSLSHLSRAGLSHLPPSGTLVLRYKYLVSIYESIFFKLAGTISLKALTSTRQWFTMHPTVRSECKLK